MKISRDLYSENEARAINSLIEDESSKSAVLQQMGKTLLNNDSILISPSLEQMILIFSVPSFDKTDDEVVFVSQITLKYLPKSDILPLSIEHKGYDFAARTLISCGFFRMHLSKDGSIMDILNQISI
jgi:hypothetical protein